jgi:hypothetical protein
MRDNLEKVTIVLTKEQHQRFRELAKKCHGSLSQYLRLAGENLADENKYAQALNFRQIIKKLETNSNIIDQIEEKLKRTEKQTEYIVNKIGDKTEKIADDIEELLLKKSNLSVPEMINYLPYSQEEIISGIEKLEERFLIEKISRPNAPSKWRIRGDTNDTKNR